MNVYKYDEITKEYTGVETAHLDPLESKAQGKDVFLLPANATFTAPLIVKEGYAQVFKDGVWNYVEDHRGEQYWLADDEFGTPAKEMKELGAFPEGAVFTAPEKPLKLAKKEKWDEVNAWTARKITGGFVCLCYNNEPVLYDTDQDTQITMGKARANCKSEKFAISFPNGMPCRGYVKVGEDENGNPVFDTDKTILFFTPEQIIAWDEDFSLFLSKCKGEGWAKQAEVEAATTVEELEAIELP